MNWIRTAQAAAIVFALLPAITVAEVDREEATERARACLDCHETPSVMGILDTKHAKFDNPKSPAAQKQCQSCHGPSSNHMQFPMQVANVHFGSGSKASAKIQNAQCLECHKDGEQQEWSASAHGFEEVVCAKCHVMHSPDKIVPRDASVNATCTTSCHQDLLGSSKPLDFTHAVGRPIDGKGELTCAGCHNPHGPLESARCIDCHAQTPEILSKQTEKAQRYHEVAVAKNTECMRCHKGIAHPIKPQVLRATKTEMDQLITE